LKYSKKIDKNYSIVRLKSFSLQKVHAGAEMYNLKKDEKQKFLIEKVFIHPKFNYEKLVDDIAILYLKGRFQFNQFVMKATLPPPEDYEPSLGESYINNT
jgi:hypothetical protein